MTKENQVSDVTAHYLAMRDTLIENGAYNPEDEKDSCGVGMVVSLDSTQRREVVAMAIKALKNVWHRGAVDADGKTGDGAGIRIDVPQEFFREQVRLTGHKPSDEPICVGQIFLPRTDFGAQERARTIVESEVLRAGFYLYGWRQVPVDISVIGQKANDTRPEIEQILFYDPQGRDPGEKERALYLCRRRIEKQALTANLLDFYICSFSSRSVVYKGMFLAEHIDTFYPDLQDERFVSSVAIYHQRYSTNTFPQWRLAQPFRMLAHNGEINTIKGNINWMKSHQIKMASQTFGDYGPDVKPVIQPGSSDSAALDAAFEILVRAGRSAPMAKSLLVPEAWAKHEEVMKPSHRALYAYCNAVMEPWDGPAALAIYDGRWAVAGLDRNGLRPLRYSITEDKILAVGSETGMCPLENKIVLEHGALGPGEMLAYDTHNKKLYRHEEMVDKLAAAHPYEKWLENVFELEEKCGPGEEPLLFKDKDEFRRRQVGAGFSFEDMETILAPMAEEGKEAIGSMGDDTALAILSKKYRPLSHFFKQNFSQVTNPPIDPLREERVMSLKTRFKNLGNILAQDETQTDVFVVESPFISTGTYIRMLPVFGDSVAFIDCSFDKPKNPAKAGDGLREALSRIRAEAEDAVRSGKSQIILTDEYQSASKIPVPMILATGGVHAHLVDKGLRTYCSIIVRSAECLDTHYFAVLVGVGATCVNAYIAQEAIADRHARGLLGDLSLNQAVVNYKKAIEAGLMKILSKMGISVISSYRGGYNFEALGLSRALASEFFPGMPSRVSGIGLIGIAKKCYELHEMAWESARNVLPIGGFYKLRAGGEQHALEAKQIHLLQTACNTGSYHAYKTYIKSYEGRDPMQIRDLLDFKPINPSVPLEEVESINNIRKRFVTPGMSLGALSPEAHGTLNIAMNRIGAKSVSGEGGEDRARYQPLPNGDNPNSAVKQIASGRFGVTAEYLNQCREIEIKVAQGAKPGEGGQLPGFKVTEFIAKLRHATPGVTLISPPPHHDIYSIEDLAQLIYDLKQINPIAKVCVKLVSQAGVGTVAAGVAKAKADIILISGGVGGTGASPQTSIKYAGLPWELGLAEAHQVLTLNNLRDQVLLRTDGGLRNGRDIVMAAMLGAEEYGIGTASLVAMGCIMVRQCQSNTCPVGVCVQDEALRKKFTGNPEKVVNLMSFIAEEVREILAELGFKHLHEVIGRTDLLAQVSRGPSSLDDLDLNPLMVQVEGFIPSDFSKPKPRIEVPEALDEQIINDAEPFFERGEKMQVAYRVRNVQRAIGTRASSHIVRKFGMDGIAEGRLVVKLEGSCGQSLGAFGVKGLTLDVVGDANDYVGKGLSGATIMLRPSRSSGLTPHKNAIIGNTCMYGATSGKLFAAGRAGERFAVRNSGATAVVEGVGANGCEYMTGGTVVILGKHGGNFAAGMTGGMAFVWDEDDMLPKNINSDSVIYQRIETPYYLEMFKSLVLEHVENTNSARGRDILEHFDIEIQKVWQVVPKEMLSRLENPVKAVAAE
ncbi:glutamate synthase large subunit [Pseudaquidulcibacter saccharophilus]|uniref:glutamate synthase large subunit n=1 Tax=Pseudaquidulcibacter saccharophilus TaxID=2831900 RepID=UPI001EFF546D|nr:glutamate synthase large subunit [Pseudaquidulcibacter saccharophilus]